MAHGHVQFGGGPEVGTAKSRSTVLVIALSIAILPWASVGASAAAAKRCVRRGGGVTAPIEELKKALAPTRNQHLVSNDSKLYGLEGAWVASKLTHDGRTSKIALFLLPENPVESISLALRDSASHSGVVLLPNEHPSTGFIPLSGKLRSNRCWIIRVSLSDGRWFEVPIEKIP